MTFVPKGMKSEEEYANIVTSSEWLFRPKGAEKAGRYF